MPVSVIERRAAPVRAAVGARHEQRAFRCFGTAEQNRRRVERPRLVLADDLLRLGLELRREVDQIVVGHALLIECRRLRRNRLRRRIPLAGHVALRHRLLDDRPDRLAGDAIEDEDVRLLRHLRHAP